ncbi:MAG: LPS-assembly protein LptD [Chlorobi bacterium]|nr:LPS-assembly protein LptD [Chlorobiota bacterium]
MKAILTILIFSLLLLSAFTPFFGQEVGDSLSVSSSVSDSLIVADSLNAETDSLQIKKKRNEVNAVVYANAKDSIIFDISEKKMRLFNEADIKYKNTELSAGKVDVNFSSFDIYAKGIADSTTSDSLQTKNDSLAQTPVLIEGEETYEGKWLRYNFRTKQGYISYAVNRKENSRYLGEKVKKVDEKTYFIKHGIYTTCKSDPPQTYFEASEMKVIQGDKIISRWIFMFIAGVPVPVPVPFAVFPNETGRRSGLIVPTFGQTSRQGSYFRNFGYFFALSEYYDLTLAGDYYTRGGYGAKARFRYAKRYNFTGNLNATFSKQIIGESNDPDRTVREDWNLSFYHNQKIDPTMRLDVNLRFQSGTFYENNSTGYNDLLKSDVISNATFSKNWDSGINMTLNYNRRQELQTGNIYEDMPNLTVSVPVFFPFKSKGNALSREKKWFESIGISYAGQMKNRRNKVDGDLKIRGGIQHAFNINSNTKIGYFNISPRASYQEKWYNKHIVQHNYIIEEIDSTTGEIIKRDSLVTEDIRAIKAVRTFNVGISAQTKLYGMMRPNMFGIEAFRHTIEPRVTYSYRPDFSDNKWGYYDSYYNAEGKEVRYDKFGKEIYGGASSGESQMLTFSLGNIFEMKTMKDPTDTTSQQNKIRLLNVDANMSYNFAADSLRLSDLTIGYRTQIASLFNFSASTSYTFYDYDEETRINKFLASEGKGLFRLRNLSLSVSTTLSGDKIKETFFGKEEKSNGKEPLEGEHPDLRGQKHDSIYEETNEPDFTIPWNLSFSYNYSLSKNSAAPPLPPASMMSMNFSINLTKNWKITARGSYDFQRKEFSAPQIDIYRNLDCWEMNFVWNPIGTYRGFRFEIRMTAPELRDIKVTKSEGLYTGRR